MCVMVCVVWCVACDVCSTWCVYVCIVWCGVCFVWYVCEVGIVCLVGLCVWCVCVM